MVLAGSTHEDNMPPSDSVPYSSSSGTENSSKLPLLAKYPTTVTLPPFGLKENLLYSREENYKEKVAQQLSARMDMARAWINRFPTQEETNAFVDQSVSCANISQTGPPLGLIFGFFVMYRMADKPKGKPTIINYIDVNSKTPSKLFGRLLIVPLCISGIGALFRAIGVLYSESKASEDERLAQLRTEISTQDPKVVEGRLRQIYTERAAELAASRKGTDVSQARKSEYFSSSDTSPTGGYYSQNSRESSNSYDQYGSPIPTDSKILGEVYSSQNGFQRRAQQQQQQQQSQSYPYPGSDDRAQPEPSSQSFWDDDASPTNPNVNLDPAPVSRPSGNAWARIRGQAVGQSTPNNDNPRFQDQDYPSGGNRSRFQTSDPNSGPTEGEAQRDFDRLLESERQIGNGEQGGKGSAWGRKW